MSAGKVVSNTVKQQPQSEEGASGLGSLKSKFEKINFKSFLQGDFKDPKKRKIIMLGVLAILGLVVVFFYSYGPDSSQTASKAVPKRISTKTGKTSAKQKRDFNTKTDKDLEKINKLKEEAVEYFNEKKYDKSMYVYKQLIEMSPTESEYYNNYGLSLKRMGKIKGARQAYHTALALQPDYPEALNNLAVIEMADKKYNDAKRRLELAIQTQPDYLDPYLHLALCLEKTGDIETAIQYYKSFLEMSEGKINRKIRLQIENRLAKLHEDIE